MAKRFSSPDFTDHIADALKREAAEAEPSLRRSSWMDKLATDIDAGDTTISNWVHGINPPPGDALLILFAHLGDDFANDVLAVIDRRIVPLDAGEVDTSQLADIQAGADALSAMIQKARDGASAPKLREVK